MPEAEQRRCGVRIGSDYPAPLVEHQAAAREARQRIQQARRAAEARAESKTIYQRHGSRKRRPHRAQAEARNQTGSGQGELCGDGS
jgi:deoxyribodipyrimidine photo-lyase